MCYDAYKNKIRDLDDASFTAFDDSSGEVLGHTEVSEGRLVTKFTMPLHICASTVDQELQYAKRKLVSVLPSVISMTNTALQVKITALNGDSIRGSPFWFTIKPGPVAADSCSAVGEGDWASRKWLVGSCFQFKIITRDIHGIRRAGDDADVWRVWLQGPAARIQGTIALDSEQELRVSVEVSVLPCRRLATTQLTSDLQVAKVGRYTVGCTFNGQSCRLAGCPRYIEVLE